MLFLELQNKQAAEQAKGQAVGASRRNRQLQTQDGVLTRNLDAAASDLGSRVAVVRDVLRQTATKLTSAEVKASQALANSVVVSADLTQTKRSMSDKIAGLSDTLQSTVLAVRSVETDGRRQENQLRGHLATHDDSILRFSEALSGNIKL